MIDLNLSIKPKADDGLVASYTCPCGCNPRLAYQRGVEHVADGCCCGNVFAVGTKAEDHLHAGEGFVRETQLFDAPWGERIQAVWTIGQSVDPGSDHGNHDHHDEHAAHDAGAHDAGAHDARAAHAAQPAGPVLDPVCGMTVDSEAARAKGLFLNHLGVDYFFCGKGCKLEFGDDPARFLDSAYVPSM